jgi:hypothetical protein
MKGATKASARYIVWRAASFLAVGNVEGTMTGSKNLPDATVRVLRTIISSLIVFSATAPLVADDALSFDVKVETIVEHDDGAFLWYHPRAAVVQGKSGPEVFVTLQKHLMVSDYYSGLFVMRRPLAGDAWSGPVAIPELGWRHEQDVTIAVADVTPGWHAPSNRLLAIGCRVPYTPKGEQIADGVRQHQTAYAVYDPDRDAWAAWKILAMPEGPKFNFSRSACAQWLTKPDGKLLVPVYFGRDARGPWSVTVAECSFDGQEMKYLCHGDELELNVSRGLVEPSIVAYDDRYFLTIRNDERGYVSVSEDGLHWSPIEAWTFDDGKDLGSYNTQQHWLAHSEGLFLVYTRRGAGNDHMFRHRAPLFIARVDPKSLRVVRDTERVLIPERGGELGNFGAAAIDSKESWVTVSEGVWSDDARRRGAKGATFVARVVWSRPNRLVTAQSTAVKADK